jgi:alpha-tubulin suppressor-like RCC1 family protein
MNRIRTLSLICLGFVTACSGAEDVAAPEQPALKGTLVVSDAAPAPDGTSSGSSITYAFASLPTGTLSGIAAATVRNRTTGESVAASVLRDGAVDPVRLPAATGDTIELTAVDGGGDEHTYLGQVKKRVPPVVVRSDPGMGVTDAPALLRVRVVFSEPLTIATVTNGTVMLLLRDQPVDGRVELSPDGLTAEFVPEDSLVAGGTYTLVVTRSVEDRTGDSLVQEYRTEFTVEPYTGPTIAFASVVTGREFSCALGRQGEVYCWGRGESGQLGVPDRANHHRPTRIGVPSRAVELSAGLRAACALTDGQVAMCWGMPYYDYAQYPKPLDRFFTPEPTAVFGTGPILQVAAGGGRMCALDHMRSLLCFGERHMEERFTRVPQDGVERPKLMLTDTSLIEVSVAVNHDCYVDSSRVAYCAGDNRYGQLGDGARYVGWDTLPPVHVAGDLRFTAITAGNDFTCGLVEAKAYCWGWNAQGELGLGAYPDRNVPSPVAGELRFSLIDAGSYHTCGLTLEGVVYCWGDNRMGQLGDGTRTQRPAPVSVIGGLRFRSISAGVDQTCGVTLDDVLYCWGGNRAGQLGDGSTSDALTPIKAAYQR